MTIAIVIVLSLLVGVIPTPLMNKYLNSLFLLFMLIDCYFGGLGEGGGGGGGGEGDGSMSLWTITCKHWNKIAMIG